MSVIDNYKTVEITKKVPVNDNESLAMWLNQELAQYPEHTLRDAGLREKILGSTVISLIEEAGFTLQPPSVKR